MGFFNFVETFFFISLAITFVLIMMLVYHFKERLSALEKKSNTIVEIINNVVKEMTFMKCQQVPQVQHQMGSTSFSQNPLPYLQLNENENEDEDDASESDDDDNSAGYESDGYEDLGEEKEESDDRICVTEEESENIKRIHINLSAPVNEDLEDLEEIQEIESEEIDLEDKIDHVEIGEPEDPIVINKIDESNEPNVEEVKVAADHNDVDFYRKMEIGALRTLVISKGLASDTKKMKKSDLVRLLESSHE